MHSHRRGFALPPECFHAGYVPVLCLIPDLQERSKVENVFHWKEGQLRSIPAPAAGSLMSPTNSRGKTEVLFPLLYTDSGFRSPPGHFHGYVPVWQCLPV